MNPKDVIARVLRPLARAWGYPTEGLWRPGPYLLPVTGGWLPASVGQQWNWWQDGFTPISGLTRSAMVEACVSAYSQTVSMCPGDHWRTNDKGGRDRVTTSALSRFLRHPNDYQTPSDFMLNLTRHLYLEGNAYAMALRNDRFEIDSLHLMNPRYTRPIVAVDGEVFYYTSGNDVIWRRLEQSESGRLVVPMRDMMHVKLHCPVVRHPYPLLGDTPLTAAMYDVFTSDAILTQQANFYSNQARPAAVLSTDLVLDKDQLQALRDRWDEQSRMLYAGGTPILTAGLKVQPWTTAGKDAEMAEMLKLTEQHIAMAYRIPLAVLGIAGGAPYSSTELLMQSWIASGLGFCLNHIEEEFGRVFGLKGQPDDYVEFSTKALLRSQFKDRIDSLVRGVQGGIFSPNEARNEEGFDGVKDGDEPRVQAQVVPLSAAGAIPTSPVSPSAPPAGVAGGKPPEPEPGKSPEPEPSEQKLPSVPKPKGNPNAAKWTARSLVTRADTIRRRRYQ